MQSQLLQQGHEVESNNDGVSIGEILNTLWLRKRLIVTITMLISILAERSCA